MDTSFSALRNKPDSNISKISIFGKVVSATGKARYFCVASGVWYVMMCNTASEKSTVLLVGKHMP